MVELRWIQMSLFLMLLLQFTGANGQRSLFIRVAHDVTLPCENVINDQNKCDKTTWIFTSIGSTGVVELIRLGKIHENGVKSDRLSVTENCSLAIKKVTDEDVGLYACQQFDKSGQIRAPDSGVLLSVVSLTEQKYNDEVTLNCHIETFEKCTRNHRVKWLFNHQVVDKDHKDLRTSESPCSASLHFKTSHYIYTSRFNILKCEVTDGDKVQLFSFITEPSACSGCSAVNYIMLVLRVVELLLITLITVLLFRASGNQKPSDDHTVKNDEDEDEGVVNYETFGDSSASVVLH